MRKHATQYRSVRWIRTLALATATCAVTDLAVAADDGPALEANPFFSARAVSPTPSYANAASASASIARKTADAEGPAGLRRLPAPPRTVSAKDESPLASALAAPRRLPPPLPASDANVASLTPTLPLESPAPSGRPFAAATVPSAPSVAPPKGTSLAAIARTRSGEIAPAETISLGELEDYRLDVNDAQLGIVAEQARTLVDEGIGLAERGAFFSARSNFVGALRAVAHALDGESRRPIHADALAAGLEALEEAGDFASNAQGVDVAALAATHQTPALSDEQASVATPNDAMRAYYSFAAEALSRCGGSSEAAAEALFQLGKLQAFLAEKEGLGSTAAIPRSTALYHAALAVSPRHARAGNELGFLLAKSGDYAHARAMLQQAVASAPLAEAWHNLAVVHERLGETELASQARERFSAIAAAQGGTSVALGSAATPRVTWVAPESMKTPPADAFPSQAPASAEAVRTASPDEPDAERVR